MISLEGVRNLMILSNYLHNRFVRPLIEKRKEEEELRRAQGVAIGKAEVHAEWRSWNQRRLEAESKGEQFTEPPPSSLNEASPTQC